MPAANLFAGGKNNLKREGGGMIEMNNIYLCIYFFVKMQQHIQLVTQMRLLSSHNPSFTEVYIYYIYTTRYIYIFYISPHQFEKKDKNCP